MNNNLSNMSDELLYAMLSEEDGKAKQAFDELYSRYSGKIYSYCCKVLKSNEQAEDIFQEVFTRIFQTAKKNSDMKNFPGFIIRITRNLCLNEKVRKCNSNVSIEDYTMPTYDKSYAEKQLYDLLEMAIEELPLKYKEVFVLKEYMDMSYKEIAKELDLTLAVVRIRIFRAKSQIKDILSPYIAELK